MISPPHIKKTIKKTPAILTDAGVFSCYEAAPMIRRGDHISGAMNFIKVPMSL